MFNRSDQITMSNVEKLSGFDHKSAGLGTDSNLISATRASGHTAIGGGTQKVLGR
jgi:hypothetical protein